MFLTPQDDSLDMLLARLERAVVVTPALLADVIVVTCAGRGTAVAAQVAARLGPLVRSEAWTDAGLTLAEIALPRWTLRRVVHDDGEWWCSLGRHWPLPAWLDDTVETHHEALAPAILMAILRAHREERAASEPHAVAPFPARPLRTGQEEASCCDNLG